MVRVGGGAGGWEMVQTAVEAHEDDLHSPYWEGVREAAAQLGRKPCTPWGQPPGVVYLTNNDATADELVDLKNEEADPLIYIIL
ncbi:hypothetical protein QYE76_066533 [Lolium multiflorum]|uniref:Uncharacterized protein n=1 Tax=Lolium multiflorum TaxID=4521 RepID=A0AAD8SBR2_LOLMU|nr:hypothetical protein QYE76_066533 [Lolium multiflorum]